MGRVQTPEPGPSTLRPDLPGPGPPRLPCRTQPAPGAPLAGPAEKTPTRPPAGRLLPRRPRPPRLRRGAPRPAKRRRPRSRPDALGATGPAPRRTGVDGRAEWRLPRPLAPTPHARPTSLRDTARSRAHRPRGPGAVPGRPPSAPRASGPEPALPRFLFHSGSWPVGPAPSRQGRPGPTRSVRPCLPRCARAPAVAAQPSTGPPREDSLRDSGAAGRVRRPQGLLAGGGAPRVGPYLKCWCQGSGPFSEVKRGVHRRRQGGSGGDGDAGASAHPRPGAGEEAGRGRAPEGGDAGRPPAVSATRSRVIKFSGLILNWS